jgi:nitronate monooxygenase
VFSGRAGRSVATDYVLSAIGDNAPPPAPYPVQRGLTAAMRAQAAKTGDVQRMQAWAGQSVRLGRVEPAGQLVRRTWQGTLALLEREREEI